MKNFKRLIEMQAGLRKQGSAQRLPSAGSHYLPEVKRQRGEGNFGA